MPSPSDKPAPTRNLPRVELGQNLTPATETQMGRLRAVEVERKRWDPSYIDAEQARGIPNEVLDAKPELTARIKYSAPDWPENHASATQALGPLDGGAGEITETRALTFDELAQGEVNALPKG